MSELRRVPILVEGQTEEQFADKVLRPHLWTFGLDLLPTRVATKRVEGRREHRGGGGRFELIRDDLRRLLQTKPFRVTSLFDLYAFPSDWAGFPGSWPVGTAARASALAAAFEKDIVDSHQQGWTFIAGLATHEFEGLLFSDTAKLAETLEPDATRLPALAASLATIRAGFATPEDINNSPLTAPSKRILGLVPTYNKPRQGVAAAKAIGLAAIRSQCPLFNAWVTRLENL